MTSSEAYIPPFSESIEEASVLVPLCKTTWTRMKIFFSFINDFIDLSRFSKQNTLILNTETYFNIQNEDPESRQLSLNLHKINDFRRLNLYFIKVNEMLKPGGVFICRGETIAETRNRFCTRFTPYLGMLFYGVDFLFAEFFRLPILQGWVLCSYQG